MHPGIQHYPTLIPELMDDHRQLLQTFGDLVRAADAHDGAAFKRTLASFKSLLVAHLLKEAVKLYIYLRQNFKGDDVAYGLVTGYKKEMDGIGRVAMDFIDTYVDTPEHAIDFPVLQSTLNEIGKVLADRIRREEAALYPLYQLSG